MLISYVVKIPIRYLSLGIIHPISNVDLHFVFMLLCLIFSYF